MLYILSEMKILDQLTLSQPVLGVAERNQAKLKQQQTLTLTQPRSCPSFFFHAEKRTENVLETKQKQDIFKRLPVLYGEEILRMNYSSRADEWTELCEVSAKWFTNKRFD